MTSCRSDKPGTVSDVERIRLEGEKTVRHQRQELLRLRLNRLSRPVEELAALANQMESQDACIATLAERRAALQQENDLLESRKTELRRAALRQARERATGSYLPELTVANGRSYKKVTIAAITDGGMEIRHESGTARLTAADLGGERGESFGLDAVLSQAAILREESDQRDYEQWVTKQLAGKAGVAEPKKNAKTPVRPAPATPRTNAASTSASVQPSSPLRDKPRYFGGVRSATRYRTYYTYRVYATPSATLFGNSSSVVIPATKANKFCNETATDSNP